MLRLQLHNVYSSVNDDCGGEYGGGCYDDDELTKILNAIFTPVDRPPLLVNVVY